MKKKDIIKNVYTYGGLFIVLVIIFIIYCSINNKNNAIINNNVKKVIQEKYTNIKDSNTEGYKNFSSKKSSENDITNIIENKLKALTQELGNISGIKESKETLKKTKKICDMESAKCMMNMLNENKGLKSINFDNVANDDSSEDCIKCKKYTELSKSIQNMIDSL